MVCMKKLDKLILSSFLGPFILTFFVVVFILLTQFLLKYFEDFVGKDLGWQVFSELIFYFSISMTPVALPLAVLLSSLMTFGNLGEHFELTAIKSSGISLLRALRPIFVFVVFLSIAAFFFNNYIVPKANLKAYSLLYDMRQKKPSLDIKEGVFYNGIPGYSIKVNKKLSDGVGLLDVIIYDHTKGMGNTDVIFADSGRMYTFLNDRYMMLELYNGNNYSESEPIGSRNERYKKKPISQFVRSSFHKSQLVFNLSSFDMKRTREELFQSNRLMKNLAQLRHDLDSMKREIGYTKVDAYQSVKRYYLHHLRDKIEIPEDLQRLQEEKMRKSFTEMRYGGGDMSEMTPVKSKTPIAKNDTLEKGKIKKKDLSKTPKKNTESPDNVPKITKARQDKDPVKQEDKVISYNPANKAKNLRRDTDKVDVNAAYEKLAVKDKEQTAFVSSGNDIKKTSTDEAKKKIADSVALAKKNLEDILNADSLVIAKGDSTALTVTDSLGIVHIDSVAITKADSIAIAKAARLDSIFNQPATASELIHAVGQARFVKNNVNVQVAKVDNVMKEYRVNDVERMKKYSMAVSCLVMFLIGAPLGAIIKKGGLGVPVILSIFFFIIFYVIMIMGEKYAKEAIVPVAYGVWAPNTFLLPFGLFFLRQARKDARLLEADFYLVFFEKIKKRFGRKDLKPDIVNS